MKREIDYSFLSMDTVVNIKIITELPEEKIREKFERVSTVFKNVETACSRFSTDSELMTLCSKINQPTKVSDILFGAISFALAVTEESEGLFDPCVGILLEKEGFNKHYLTGEEVNSEIKKEEKGCYKDIELDELNQIITIKKPIIIDLGAVAKGFAIDLAVLELQEFENFVIEAGGDLYVKGKNDEGKEWVVGIQHPEDKESIIATLAITNAAVCTSGGYERVSEKNKKNHHLVNPLTGLSETKLLSTTVIAPFAMMADAYSTLCYIAGEEKGYKFLEEAEIDGIFITQKLEVKVTETIRRCVDFGK